MANEMDTLRRRMNSARDSIPEEDIAPHELEDPETIEEKAAVAKYRSGLVKRVLKRFRKCRNVNDVFAENAMDAAMRTVLEMHLAASSVDRQRAAESVLNRALGKPVDRIMSVAMQVSSKTDVELDHDIKRLLADLGYQGGEGTSRQTLIGGTGISRSEQIARLSPESRLEWKSGVPRKIYTVSGED